MMKFIHLTDTHIVGGDKLLFGANPRKRLDLAIESINRDHADAECVIVTGDLTHWGDEEAYQALATGFQNLTVPWHLMMGNHDEVQPLVQHIPSVVQDANGFLQSVLDTSAGPFVMMDTKPAKGHHGAYCDKRLKWLDTQLNGLQTPGFLFMHHPPFKIGIASLDSIHLRDGEALYEVLDAHRDKIRYLFFGHVHRIIHGTWRGFPYAMMRGLNHQVDLNLNGSADEIGGDFANPAYGVVLVEPDQVTIHMHDFMDASPKYALHDLAAGDSVSYALDMRHDGWSDFTTLP